MQAPTPHKVAREQERYDRIVDAIGAVYSAAGYSAAQAFDQSVRTTLCDIIRDITKDNWDRQELQADVSRAIAALEPQKATADDAEEQSGALGAADAVEDEDGDDGFRVDAGLVQEVRDVREELERLGRIDVYRETPQGTMVQLASKEEAVAWHAAQKAGRR